MKPSATAVLDVCDLHVLDNNIDIMKHRWQSTSGKIIVVIRQCIESIGCYAIITYWPFIICDRVDNNIL